MWGIWVHPSPHFSRKDGDWLREVRTDKAILVFDKEEKAKKRAANNFGYDSYDKVKEDGWCEVRPFDVSLVDFSEKDIQDAIFDRLSTFRQCNTPDDMAAKLLAQYCHALCVLSVKNFLLRGEGVSEKLLVEGEKENG